MNEEEAKKRLRRLVPWIVAAIIFMLGSCVAVVISGRHIGIWPMIVGDAAFTVVLLFFLWRALGKKT
jgi:hypothetical protein